MILVVGIGPLPPCFSDSNNSAFVWELEQKLKVTIPSLHQAAEADIPPLTAARGNSMDAAAQLPM